MKEMVMQEKIALALDTAEKNYLYLKNLERSNKELEPRPAEHILALSALFEAFVHYGFAVSQITTVICEVERESLLFESLIEPHLRVVDDVEMIARQYSKMYVQYIVKIAHGSDTKHAIEHLFAK
jgi:hypothetical protein